MQLLFLFGGFSSAESMLFYLVFNLFWCVSHEYPWLRHWTWHFRTKSLQRREKLVVKSCRFRSFDFAANISGHSEIRVLVDSTRNKARNVLVSEEMRETARKTRSCLNGRICGFSTIVWKLEAENGSQSCHIYVPLKTTNVRIQASHVLGIQADKSILRVKANR